jgi:hypothetical protein
MKFYYFTIIAVGIMFCLAMFGYDLPITGGIMNAVGIINQSSNTTNLDFQKFNDIDNNLTNNTDNNNNIFDKLIYVLIGAIGVGITISFFGRTPDINYIFLILISLLAWLVTTDYVWIIHKALTFKISWISWTMSALFTALLVGFYISILEFARGTD